MNAYRAANGSASVDESQFDSSRVNLVDLRVCKSFAVRGDTRVEVMGQVFNLCITTNLLGQFSGGRVSNALSDSFGRILAARDNRQVELAVKFIW